jgi:hypothetical protein
MSTSNKKSDIQRCRLHSLAKVRLHSDHVHWHRVTGIFAALNQESPIPVPSFPSFASSRFATDCQCLCYHNPVPMRRYGAIRRPSCLYCQSVSCQRGSDGRRRVQGLFRPSSASMNTRSSAKYIPHPCPCPGGSEDSHIRFICCCSCCLYIRLLF